LDIDLKLTVKYCDTKTAHVSTQFIYSFGSVNLLIVSKAAFRKVTRCSCRGGQLLTQLPSERSNWDLEIPGVSEALISAINSNAFVAMNSELKELKTDIRIAPLRINAIRISSVKILKKKNYLLILQLLALIKNILGVQFAFVNKAEKHVVKGWGI